VGETGTTSGGVLCSNVSTALVPLASGITCSCIVVSTPSASVFDEGSPITGLSKGVSDGVRRLSIAASEGDEEKEDWVDVGMPPISPG